MDPMVDLTLGPWGLWLTSVCVLCTKTRYKKPASEEETGVMETKESPVHHSNVMHYSKEQKVRSRVGIK